MQERGLVYCDSGNCILVPTVCRNVSRITRAEVSPEHAEAPEAPDAPGGAVPGGPGGTDTDLPGTSIAGGVLPGVPAARPLSLDPESSFEEASSPGFPIPPGADFSSPSTPQGGPGASPLPPSVFVPGLGVPPPVGFPGAILTPGPDVVSQFMMATPMIVLYNISILLAWRVTVPCRRSLLHVDWVRVREEKAS